MAEYATARLLGCVTLCVPRGRAELSLAAAAAAVASIGAVRLQSDISRHVSPDHVRRPHGVLMPKHSDANGMSRSVHVKSGRNYQTILRATAECFARLTHGLGVCLSVRPSVTFLSWIKTVRALYDHAIFTVGCPEDTSFCDEISSPRV